MEGAEKDEALLFIPQIDTQQYQTIKKKEKSNFNRLNCTKHSNEKVNLSIFFDVSTLSTTYGKRKIESFAQGSERNGPS